MRPSILFLLLATLMLAPAFASQANAESMNVQVKEADVRSAPSFLAKIIAKLPYGRAVNTQGKQGNWVKVTAPKAGSGFVHESALTTEDIALSSGGNVGSGASSDEVALAGKGFNQQTETAYRRANPGLSYQWINKMEQINVSPQQSQAFLEAGDVKPAGGLN